MRCDVIPVLTTLVVSVSPACGGDPLSLGAIGDSLTDEYLEQSYDYASAWTELLVEFRDVDMGPTAFEAGQPGGSWGEPRRSGYEHNWVRFGATTGDMLNTGQHTGLRDSSINAGVMHAAMFIGGNDFSPWSGCYDFVYDEQWTEQDIDNWIAGRLANINTALDTVLTSEIDLVVVNIADFSIMPYVWSGHPDAARRELMANVVAQANAELAAIADVRGLALVDMFALTKAMFGPNAAQHEVLEVGDVEIFLLQSDPGDGSAPNTGWVDDGIHPHTVIQGIWANAIVTALNMAHQAGVPRFTESEILAQAGLEYGGTDTLATQIGEYADYVHVHCAGDLDGDADIGFSDIVTLLAAWGMPDGDVTGDGTTGFEDLLAVLSAWGDC